MKNRLLPVLLSLLLVMSLACSLVSVTAFADGDTITYELKKGDTVGKVCKDLGIDFEKNYLWITKTNNITNYSTLPVGKKLILPAPGKILTYTAPTAPTATPAPTAAVNPNALPDLSAGDVVTSYIVSHTLRSGETVYKVCNSYGISFQQNSDTITKLNNITNYAKLKVGQVLLLPSTVAPASGSYYKVVAHRVVKGDTVVGLCKTYGIEYGKNEQLLKIVNNKTNMASIKVGEIVYIPVPSGTAVTGGTLTPGTGTSTQTTTQTITYTLKKGDTVAKVCKELGVDFAKNQTWIKNTNNIRDFSKLYVGQVLILPAPGVIASGPPAGGTSTNTNTNTNTGSGSRTMHTGANGTYIMQVGGVTVNTANPGQTVTIYPIPDKGYVLNGISVTKTGGSDAVTVTNNSFVMPDYDVTISVTFKAAS